MDMTADGRKVVFIANSGLPNENTKRVLLWDADDDSIQMVSENLQGSVETGDDSRGRFIVYTSGSSVPGRLNVWDCFAHVSVYTNWISSGVGRVPISPDGRTVVYATSSGLNGVDWGANNHWLIMNGPSAGNAGMRFSAASRFLTYAASLGTNWPRTNHVFVYDFQTRSKLSGEQKLRFGRRGEWQF